MRFLINCKTCSLNHSLIQGHLQSGQYLWPAAMFGSNHIINNWTNLCSNIIIELGSGCGLCGLVTSKMTGIEYVLMTDYDPGAIEIIRSNVNMNKQDKDINYHVEMLEWGSGIPSGIVKALSLVEPTGALHSMLVLGTDLLYSVDIVAPLIKTVNGFLLLARESKGLFVLVSSFDIGENIQTQFNHCVNSAGLVVDEIVPLDVAQNVCRVQYIRRPMD